MLRSPDSPLFALSRIPVHFESVHDTLFAPALMALWIWALRSCNGGTAVAERPALSLIAKRRCQNTVEPCLRGWRW